MNYSISTNDSLCSKSNKQNNNSQIISYSLNQFQNGGIKKINQNENNINKYNLNKSNKNINNKNILIHNPSHTPVITPDSIFRTHNHSSKKIVIHKRVNNCTVPIKMKKNNEQIFESEISLDENNVNSNFDKDNLNKINVNTDYKSKINILNSYSMNKLNENKKNINNNRKNVNDFKLENINKDKKINLNSFNKNNENLNNNNSKDKIINSNKISNKVIKDNFNIKIENKDLYKKYNSNECRNPYIKNYKFNKNYNINGKRISLIDNLEIFNSPGNISRSLSFKKNLNIEKLIDKKINEKKFESKLPVINRSLTPKLKELIPNGHHINENNKLSNQDNNISTKKEFYKINMKHQKNKSKNNFKGNYLNNKNKKNNLNKEIVLDNSLNEIDFEKEKDNNLEQNKISKNGKFNICRFNCK